MLIECVYYAVIVVLQWGSCGEVDTVKPHSAIVCLNVLSVSSEGNVICFASQQSSFVPLTVSTVRLFGVRWDAMRCDGVL
jgi:hypothetical protein